MRKLWNVEFYEFNTTGKLTLSHNGTMTAGQAASIAQSHAMFLRFMGEAAEGAEINGYYDDNPHLREDI